MQESSFSNTPSIGKNSPVILDPHAPALPKTLRKIIRLGAQRIVYVSATPPPKQGTCWNSLDMATNSNRSSLSINFRTAVEAVAWIESRDFNRTCRHEPCE